MYTNPFVVQAQPFCSIACIPKLNSSEIPVEVPSHSAVAKLCGDAHSHGDLKHSAE